MKTVRMLVDETDPETRKPLRKGKAYPMSDKAADHWVTSGRGVVLEDEKPAAKEARPAKA